MPDDSTRKFNKRAVIITIAYMVLLLGVTVWLIAQGYFKGVIFGKIFGFCSIVSVVIVFYIAHPKADRQWLASKNEDA